jgi:PAS domain S-box-containing protein
MTADPSIPILIVDDNPTNLLVAATALELPGYRIVKAASGEEALHCALAEDFAVILLDVYMPGLDGVETARLLRQRERSRHTPIIFVTATDADLLRAREGYGVGAVDYVFKPLQSVEILRAKVAVFAKLFQQAHVLERHAAELAAAKAGLEAEVARCKQIEEALRRSEAELEQRVEQRTAEVHQLLDTTERSRRALLDTLEARSRSEAALAESERKYRELVENANSIILRWTRDGRITFMNEFGLTFFGYSQAELLGRHVIGTIVPETKSTGRDLRPLMDEICADPKKFERNVNENMRRNGERVWIAWTNKTVFDQRGQVKEVLSIGSDITERKRAEEALQKTNRALRMLSECNQALMRAANEAELLQIICRIAVEHGGYRMAWVGFAEQDEAKSVRPAAQFAFEEGYLETVHITWADIERGRGPTGTAIRTGQPSVIRDTATDPAFAPWRNEALRRSYAAVIGLPLLSQDRTFGALTLYAVAVDAFDAVEVALLSELAADLAYGIAALRTRAERERVEAALRAKTEELDRYFTNSLDLLCIADTDGYFRRLNPEWERTLGYSLAELEGRRFLDFVHPDDVPATLAALHKLSSREHVLNFVNRYRHRDGSYRWIEWRSYAEDSRIFAVARDITERKKAEETIRRQLKGVAPVV